MRSSKKTVFVLSCLFFFLFAAGCTEDQQNKISKLGVDFFEGDYKVTFANGVHVKTWIAFGTKITSDPNKGYYYFWVRDKDGQKRYVQTPIALTYIEEVKQ